MCSLPAKENAFAESFPQECAGHGPICRGHSPVLKKMEQLGDLMSVLLTEGERQIYSREVRAYNVDKKLGTADEDMNLDVWWLSQARQNRLKPKTPEELEKTREQNRQRQQLYYARKKSRESENTASRRPKKRQTAEEEAKKREKNRVYVQTECMFRRIGRTEYPRRSGDNEKQLKYYYRKKEEKQIEQRHQQEGTPANSHQEATLANSTPYPTQAAYRKAVARVRALIKAKGSKLAFLYKGLLKFSGRKTRQTLKELNICFETPKKHSGADMRQHVEDLHRKRDKGTLSYKRRLSEGCGTQENGFSRRYLKTKNTDLYKRRTVNQTNQLMFRYYPSRPLQSVTHMTTHEAHVRSAPGLPADAR